MSLGGIPGARLERLATDDHRARVYGPRPGVHAGSANDPTNLFVIAAAEHPIGVGAGFPEPAGLTTPRRASPFFRGADYTPADQAHLSAAMVDQFGDASLIHGRFAWGPNFYGSGPTFAIVEPVTHPWAVVTYLQSLVGAGAERRPNLRLTLDAPEPVSLRDLFTALCDAEGLSAAIVIGIIRSAYLSARDWIKPAVYGERYGLKMDEYRTRITIANPTWQVIVAYLERPASGGLAIHTHVGALWGEQPDRLFAYHPTEPALLFDGPFRMKHLYHINHDARTPAHDSTARRATLYAYATSTIERITD